MKRSGRWPGWRLKLASMLLGLGVSALAVQSLLIAALGHSERAFALSLENGARHDWTVFQAVDQAGAVGNLADMCNRDLMRASVSIRLAAYDAAFAGGTEADRLRAAGDADAALRALLNCNPIDGNAWLKLAMVHASIFGVDQFDRRMMDASGWAAPNEGWIAGPRMDFAVRLYNDGAVDIADSLSADVRRLAERGDVRVLANAYVGANPTARAIFDEQIALMAKERQEIIEKSVDAALNAAARY